MLQKEHFMLTFEMREEHEAHQISVTIPEKTFRETLRPAFVTGFDATKTANFRDT